MQCPSCGGKTEEIKGKYVCIQCRRIVEACCEGGKQ